MDTLFRLMSIVAEKRGERPIPNSVVFFNMIWEYLHPRGYVKLLIVELEGKPISTEISFTFGNTVRFWKFGT